MIKLRSETNAPLTYDEMDSNLRALALMWSGTSMGLNLDTISNINNAFLDINTTIVSDGTEVYRAFNNNTNDIMRVCVRVNTNIDGSLIEIGSNSPANAIGGRFAIFKNNGLPFDVKIPIISLYGGGSDLGTNGEYPASDKTTAYRNTINSTDNLLVYLEINPNTSFAIYLIVGGIAVAK